MSRDIVTFGEILMRLSPPGKLRLRQAHSLDLVYGGAEANVAVALANFGLPVQYITRLPNNELGVSCLHSLRQHGVGCDYIEYGGSRLGLYFLEAGTGNRPAQVLYDREHSAFATIAETTIRWEEILARAGWFHWSGISPALSDGAAQVTAQAVTAAREAGLTISCDLNYRHSLWQWGQPASAVMPGLVEQCDVLVANTAYFMLGLPELPVGRNVDESIRACAQLARLYPNLKQIAMTCRETVSATEQQFTAVLWHAGQAYTSPTFSLTTVVDRVGVGDAFMAGLIYGLETSADDFQRVVSFAAASAIIKHTIVGDANLVTLEEVERLLKPQEGFDIIR
jgi:2-dehydro-3-deoxygluconokinase